MVVLEVAVLAAGHAGEEPREQLLAHAAVRHHKQPPPSRPAGRRAAAAAAARVVLLRRACAHITLVFELGGLRLRVNLTALMRTEGL